MSLLVVEASAKDSDTGRQRRANEDSLFVRSPLFVVADGMGGAQAGEIASSIAAGAFERGLPDRGGSVEERLVAIVEDANEQIHDLSVADAERAGMGTTCTALYVGEHDVSIAHVGDSRLYRFRDGAMEKLTRDHSLVEELVREGRLTPQEAEEHPQRSIITRALGPEHRVQVDSQTLPARGGDVYLMCSDGLTGMVPEARIAEIVTDEADLDEAVARLIDAANFAGGRDNITVILVRLAELDTAAPGSASEQATQVGMAPVSGPVATATAAEPATVARRVPRQGTTRAPAGGASRRRRVLGPIVFVVALLALLGIAGYFALASVYFVGANRQGFVTLYRGLPYDLPAGIRLYTTNYTSGATLPTLPAKVRATVTAHKLRARRDGADLIEQIEQGRLVAQQGSAG